jgi:hypothetical protein
VKINWKKMLESLIKSAKVQTTAKLFQDNMSGALMFFTLILLLMQVPWILYVLESFWKPKGVFALQLLGIATPTIIFCVAVVVMIVFAYGQGMFFPILAKERGESCSRWNEIAISMPILRYWILWRLLSQTARIPVLLLIGGAMMFWVFAVFVGPLSPWVQVSLVISVSAWLVIAQRLSHGVVKRSQRLWGMALLLLFAVSAVAGYVTFYWTKMEVEAEELSLQSDGIPTSREELKRYCYQGRTPSTEFRKLVDRRADYEIARGSYCLETAIGYYKLPESKRKELKAYLVSERCREDFKNIDALIESGESLKYEICLPDGDYLFDAQMPHLGYYRAIMRYFSSKIVVALEEKNSAEAMRLFRLANEMQETILQGDFVLGAGVAFSCELIRNDNIGAMLGSGILSDADLSELVELNRDREEKIRTARLHGLRTEAYLVIDTAMLLNVPYLKIMWAISIEGKREYQAPLLHFLFRGNTTVFPTPPCLWTDAVAQRYLLAVMRHQRALVRYFDDPTPCRERLRDELKQELAIQEFYLERMLFTDYFKLERYSLRVQTRCRMTGLGLQIEQFRRKHGHLPETLDELGIKLPVDALSGEPIRYAKGKVKLWERKSKNNYDFREFPGWQLSAPGENYRPPQSLNESRVADDTPQHEARCDTFTVITQWPVPPVPEPQEIDGKPSNFSSETQSSDAPEAKAEAKPLATPGENTH